jgi:Cu+-exporting ATPase
MHREISHSDDSLQSDNRLSLYGLTALLALLLFLDLWPALVQWLATWAGPWTSSLPTWPNQFGEYRLALIAAILGGARTLYGAIDALFAGRVGADLALAVACVAAILLGEQLVAAEIVFIGMLGECLENFTFERTQRALRGLVRLCPRRCWRLRGGQEERVLVSELQVNDLVVIKPGGRAPADGLVTEGRSSVDVSALTGESLPVDKGPGDEVLAGSLNQTGALTLTVQRTADHTVVGQVIALTSRALKDKAPLERTADRLARYFLPAVLTLAAVTFLGGLVVYGGGWFRPADSPRLSLAAAARLSVYPALSVLVVACPCALILATPAAVLAALGRLAGTGTLIKGGSALERLATVKAFGFDKTGTLTEGQLSLGDVVPVAGMDADRLLRIAASAEQPSEHLLARLLIDQARRRNLSLDAVDGFQAHPGNGISGILPSGKVLLGNRRFMAEQGIALSAEVEEILTRLDSGGQTVLLVALDGQVVGAIGATDRVRPEAPGVLAELVHLGIERLVMLTGDRLAAAQAAARQLDTEATAGRLEVHAELLPQQKAELIERMRGTSSPGRVAMVGDGINDAPALARADVGLAIAVGSSSAPELAEEAGDIVLMGDPLRGLPLLVRLSRATVAIIRQNILVFAFGVNAFGIVLTAWLWPILLPARWYEQGPVAAVIYHQLGSLAVLLNSMRLLWFERAPRARAGRLQQRVERLNAWMERWLNVEEGLHQLLHHWRAALAVVAGLVLAGWALSGLTQIEPDEIGIVRRFGRPLPEDLGPGLSWRWPWPIETVDRVQPERVQTIEIGYRTVPGAGGNLQARPWSSPHGQDGIRRLTDEAVMITGDGVLLELQGAVRYTVAQPHVWLYEVNDGPGLLRSAAESVLREVTGSRTSTELLTNGREAFQRDVLYRLEQRCQGFGPHGLGIRLEGLALQELHPPQDVVGAYQEVTRAMEQRDERINKAQARALADELAQQGRNLEIVRDAQATQQQRVHLAQARQAAFQARWQARNRLDLTTELLLFWQEADQILTGKPAQAVWRDFQKRRADTIAVQVFLSDFRLYWDMLASALTGRDKVIVDTEKIPGRRHLWLVPLELFRPPPMPPDRGAAREP